MKYTAVFHTFPSLLTFVLITISTLSFATNYYVSNDGNDAFDGTTPETAWQTLERVNSFIPEAGDKILFRRGDIWSGSIEITTSGQEWNTIVYGAYGVGERPVIRGGRELSGWTLHTGNIYKAVVDSAINQLFIDGESVQISGFPHNDYLTIDSVMSPTRFSCSALSGTNWTGATAILRLVGWSFEAIEIIESEGDTIIIAEDPVYTYAMEAGDYFFVINKPDVIDGPGQWAYSKAENMVYLWTPNGDSPEDHTITISDIENGIYGHDVSHITIKGLNITGFKNDGITFSGEVDDITIQENRLINNYGCGVNLYTWGDYYNDIKIYNNYIFGSNRCAIRGIGSNFSIWDNTLEDIGLLENMGINGFIDPYHAACGMFLYPVDSSEVSSNHIDNIGYIGIMFRGKENVIEKNRISMTCKTLNDGGGIYSHLDATGSIIRRNIISDCGIEGGWYDHGIYLDATANGATVEENTCFGNHGNGVIIHECENVTVSYNTLFDNTHRQAFVGHTRPDIPMSNNLFINNILYTTTAAEKNLMIWASDSMDFYTDFNNNCYGSPDEDNIFWAVNDDWIYLTIEEFQEISGLGQGAWRPQVEDYAKSLLVYNDKQYEISYNLSDGEYSDLEGNLVNELVLAPFTSSILIKDLSLFDNQQPVINNQTFSIPGNSPMGLYIDTVEANDPDEGQTLHFDLLSGNQSSLFHLMPTGALYLNEEICTVSDVYFDLEICVKDNAVVSLSDTAVITVHIEGVNTGVTPNPSMKGEIHIFPNPSKSSFYIIYNNQSETFMEIYNSYGEKIHTSILATGYNKIPATNWNAGIYYLKAETKSYAGTIFMKLVKVR